jgi:uncharacterized protein YhdP
MRMLALVLVVATVALAVTLTAGRLFVAFLPTLEGEINAALRSTGVELDGLSADWHWTNPVVEIDEVRFGGGRARAVQAELDVPESIWNLAPVLRVARAKSLELVLVHMPDGRWTLGHRSPGERRAFRIDHWLRDSDAIELPDVRVTLLDQEADQAVVLGTYVLSGGLANDSSQHRGRIVVREASGVCRDCGLVAQWSLAEAVIGSSIHTGELTARARDLRIPQALGVVFRAGGALVRSFDLVWRVDQGRGTGRAVLDARALTFPTGELDRIALDVALGSRAGVAAWGRATELDVENGSQRLSLAGTTLVLDRADSRIDVAVAPIDVATSAQLLRAAGASVEPLTRWLDALNPHGRVEGLLARLDLDRGTVSAVARVEDGAIDHYKGVPTVRGSRATIAAFEHGAELDLVPGPATVGILDLFGEVSELDALRGRIFMWMGLVSSEGSGERSGEGLGVADGESTGAPKELYLGVQSQGIDGTLGPSRITGSFGIARPEDPEEQRVSAFVGLRDMDAAVAKRYVPIKLPEGVLRFFDQGIVAGHVDEIAVAYHGHTRAVEDLPMRRLDMRATMHGGVVRYHADWPPATELAGEVEVTFDRTHGRITSGQMQGLALDSGTLEYKKGQDFIEVNGTAHGDAARALEFFRVSPLAKWMPQVDPSWSASGPIAFDAMLRVPMKREGTPLAVELTSHMDAVQLDMANWRLVVADLEGRVDYAHPYRVSADGVTGSLFGRPAVFAADTADGAVHVRATGSTTVDTLAQWLKLPPLVFSGELAFASDLVVPTATRRPVELVADSDLVGVAIAMPGEIGKAPDEPRNARARVRFDDGLFALDFASPNVTGWAHIADGAVLRGAIGVGVAPEAENRERSGMLVTGHLSELDAAKWIGIANESPGTARLPEFRVANFTIGRAFVRNIVMNNLELDANGDSEGLSLKVDGDELDAAYESRRDGVPKLTIRKLVLPVGEGTGDPLANLDQRVVPEIDADVSGVTTGGRDRGAWKLSLRQRPEGLAYTNVSGDLNGLHIESEEGGMWLREGSSTFAGKLTAGDISKVLVGYGYAPSVETKSLRGNVEFSWPGSPLNFGLAHLSGRLSFNAENGRFVDVGGTADGTRIFSLLNFTAIAKRMALDFSDVFGKGISFEEMSAKAALEDGTLRFTDPLDVAGTGSNFRVSGTVDLDGGTLNNEMIVTLPVSASLPWYAAYLGIFANPLAAGAVIVGERIFRNQIEQFSSAKYKIEGTLDEPKVSFVRVFTNSMDDSDAADGQSQTKSDASRMAAQDANKGA